MDQEKTINLQQRIHNLTPESPFSSFLSVLDSFIDLMKQETLQTGVAEPDEERQARRVAINERKQQLLELMVDPEALWADYQRREREANQ